MEDKKDMSMDIYFKNKIYVDANKTDWDFAKAIGEPSIYIALGGLTSYPVNSNHSFTDGQDVIGKYKLEHQIRSIGDKDWEVCSKEQYDRFSGIEHFRRIVAIPSADEPKDDDIEELVAKKKCHCGVPLDIHNTACGWENASLILFPWETNVPAMMTGHEKQLRYIIRNESEETQRLQLSDNPIAMIAEDRIMKIIPTDLYPNITSLEGRLQSIFQYLKTLEMKCKSL